MSHVSRMFHHKQRLSHYSIIKGKTFKSLSNRLIKLGRIWKIKNTQIKHKNIRSGSGGSVTVADQTLMLQR